MLLTVSGVRTRLGEVVTFVQTPNECVALTRRGKTVAAEVSIANLKRIWQVEDKQYRAMIWHPLNKNSYIAASPIGRLVWGLRSKMEPPKEASNDAADVSRGTADLEACVLEVVESGKWGRSRTVVRSGGGELPSC